MVVYLVNHEWDIEGTKGSKTWVFGTLEDAENFQQERVDYIVHNYDKKDYETEITKKNNFIRINVVDADRVESVSLNQYPVM